MIHALASAFWTHLFHPLHGDGYQFWSGIGSDFSELTLLAVLVGAWRHVNCGAPRCLRIGKHPTADGHHKLCRRHHPDVPDHKLSLREIVDCHHRAKERR